MRAEFAAIAAGFALLPAFSGNANKVVVVNSGGTGLTISSAPVLTGLSVSGTTQTNGIAAFVGGLIGVGGTRVNADGTGQIQGLTVSTDTTAAITTITPDGYWPLAFAVAAAGTNYTNGDTLYDPLSGSTFTATVVAGAVTALSIAVKGFKFGTFSNPVSLSGGTGSGCQMTVSVNGQVTALKLDGRVMLGTLTNAVDDAAAATAGVAVGRIYRNGSVLMQRQS